MTRVKFERGRLRLSRRKTARLRQSRRIGAHFLASNAATLFHGDCLEMLREIPNEAAQLIVTSPPYNIGKVYEQKRSLEAYVDEQRRVIAECVRVLKPGGSVCWQVGNYLNGLGQFIPLDLLVHPLFSAHSGDNGLRLRNRVIWHFEHGLHASRRFSGRHESILWYTKGDEYTFHLDPIRVPQKYPGKRAYKGPRKGDYSCNPRGKNPGDVWVFPNVKGNHPEKSDHPCQFPIELPERLILALTQRADLVVDPYCGVGTTAIAALAHGRRIACSDIVMRYLNTARRRISDMFNGVLRRRPLGRATYKPSLKSAVATCPPHFRFRLPSQSIRSA